MSNWTATWKSSPATRCSYTASRSSCPTAKPHAERRKATITRAGWIERKWVKMTGDLEFMELLEFSFSGEEL